MALALAACGGGQDNASLGPVQGVGPGTPLRGTVAVGLALAGAKVAAKCRSNDKHTYENLTLSLSNPTVFTLPSTQGDYLENALFNGQVVNLGASIHLPGKLSKYQIYYVVGLKLLDDGRYEFKLSDDPLDPASLLNTLGNTLEGSFSLITSNVVTEQVTADGSGVYSFSKLAYLGARAPCILEATGGTQTDGAPSVAVMHSIANDINGLANITPLTESLLAILLQSGDLSNYFAHFDESSAFQLRDLASTVNIQKAWDKIKARLTNNGIDSSAIASNPMTELLVPKSTPQSNDGNAYDKLLDKIKTTALSTEAAPYAKVLNGKEALITLVKLDSRGLPLKNQFAKWVDNGSELDGTRWDCVHDTATGIYWEVKRNDPNHFRHKGHKYTWYDTGKLNGGDPGAEQNATCTGVEDPIKCNTQSYVKAVNSARLCGFDAWVVPDVDTFQKFPLNNASAVIANTDYFPDIQSEPLASTPLWTRTPSANNADGKYAWTFNLTKGQVQDGLKVVARPVRLMLSVETVKIASISSANKITLSQAPSTPITPLPMLPNDNSVLFSDRLLTLRSDGVLNPPLAQTASYFPVALDNTTSPGPSFQLAAVSRGQALGTSTTSNASTSELPTSYVVFETRQAEKLEDASYCNGAIESTRPEKRYKLAAGEVTDTVTKLVWKQCAEGLSGDKCDVGRAKDYGFSDAKAVATGSWRLPTRAELATLVERKCTGVWKKQVIASGLWMSTRLFTITGGWEQEAQWSTPVAVDSAGMEFSGDGTKDWHAEASSSDYFMRKKSPVGPVMRIAGESGFGWRDGVPANPTGQSLPLWMTQRIFTANGKSPQEAQWSTPVEIKDGSTLKFSADGLSYHFPPASNDVFMIDTKDAAPTMIRGEAGGVTSTVTQVKGVAFYRGNYTEDLYPKGGSFSAPTPDYPLLTTASKQAMVTGITFYRGNYSPGTPVGGSFENPTPMSSGWSDGVPEQLTGNAPVSAADSAQAIHPKLFPQASSQPYPQIFWTSSAVSGTSAAWAINFYNGFELPLDTVNPPQPVFVRLVRSTTP